MQCTRSVELHRRVVCLWVPAAAAGGVLRALLGREPMVGKQVGALDAEAEWRGELEIIRIPSSNTFFLVVRPPGVWRGLLALRII